MVIKVKQAKASKKLKPKLFWKVETGLPTGLQGNMAEEATERLVGVPTMTKINQ